MTNHENGKWEYIRSIKFALWKKTFYFSQTHRLHRARPFEERHNTVLWPSQERTLIPYRKRGLLHPLPITQETDRQTENHIQSYFQRPLTSPLKLLNTTDLMKSIPSRLASRHGRSCHISHDTSGKSIPRINFPQLLNSVTQLLSLIINYFFNSLALFPYKPLNYIFSRFYSQHCLRNIPLYIFSCYPFFSVIIHQWLLSLICGKLYLSFNHAFWQTTFPHTPAPLPNY